MLIHILRRGQARREPLGGAGEDGQGAQLSLAWHSYQHGARLMRGKLQAARALGACCPGLCGSEVGCQRGMGTEEAASSSARS